MTATQERSRAPRAVERERRAHRRGTLAGAGLLVALVVALAAVLALDPEEPVDATGQTLTGAAAWAAVGGAALVVAVLLALGLSGRPASWRYPDASPRDRRIDAVRGIAICFLVVNHVDVDSLAHLLSQEAIGFTSGAELFVLMSGVVLGVVYRPYARRRQLIDAAGRIWRRAGTLYRAALGVVLAVFLLSLVPGLDTREVTTYTDPGRDVTYDLFAGVEGLLDFPVPPSVLLDVFLLRVGPYQTNVLGLYVVLLLVAPLLLPVLAKAGPLPVLGLSAGLYALERVTPQRIISTQFEDAFPLFAWQLLFVLGLVAGWYREELLRLARRPAGRVLVALAAVGATASAVLSWCNPYLSNRFDVRLGLLSDDEFVALRDQWFERTSLDEGRVLSVLVIAVALLGLLTVVWGPFERLLGWFLLPLGQASLYAFVMHVFLALLASVVPGAEEGTVLAGTLLHGVVLMALWLMVRTRFLFGLVPR